MKDKELKSLTHQIFRNLINHEFKMIRYFQNSLAKYLILLKICEHYFAKDLITQEQLILSIPNNISSRSNTLNILKNARERNYISKEKVKTDSRSIAIIPSDQLVKEFEQWIEKTHNTKYF